MRSPTGAFSTTRGNRFSAVAWVLLGIFLAGGCSREPVADHQDAEPLITNEHGMADQIQYQYAIYFLPTPTNNPSVALDRLLAEKFRLFQRTDKLAPTNSTPVVVAHLEDDVANEYAPPDLESLRYSGRGLSRPQAEALQNCRAALLLNLAYSKAHVWSGLSEANQLIADLARDTGGLVWDEETREVFSVEEWERRRRIGSNEVPDVSSQTTIHAYKSTDFVRAITLGMNKLGLPDVVVDEFSWENNSQVGHLINLFCQALAEGTVTPANGQFDLDLKNIKNETVREPYLESIKSNATSVAQLVLRHGRWEEGDPRNRLIELCADRYPGPDDHAKQQKLISEFFGWEDTVAQIKHNKELLKASQRAKEKLPGLRQAFQAGLAPGEFIQVKAPFDVPGGGHEYMWVSITAWKGKQIEGLLANEPAYIPDLHGGQLVKIRESDVFDYLHKRADGTFEGNETSEIIEKMSGTK